MKHSYLMKLVLFVCLQVHESMVDSLLSEPEKLVSKTCQNYVIFLENISSIQDYLSEHFQVESQQYARTVVFIIESEKADSNNFSAEIRTTAEVWSQQKLNCCVNGILLTDASCFDKLGSLVASLIFDCNTIFSGQVFHI